MRIRKTPLLCLFHFLCGKRQAVRPIRVYVQFKGNARTAESGCKQERVFDRDFLVRGSMPQENRRCFRRNMLLQRKELPLPFPNQILKTLFVAPARICCDDRIAQDQSVRRLQIHCASVDPERCGKMRAGRKPADIYRQSGMCIPLPFHRVRQSMQRPQTTDSAGSLFQSPAPERCGQRARSPEEREPDTRRRGR